MRQDLIHTPRVEDGEAHCKDCGAWLPLDTSETAVRTSGAAILEVGGLGAFCLTIRNTLGREAIACSHPSVTAQSKEITVSPCPACTDVTRSACEVCGGEGMVGYVPNPDDPEHPQILKVNGAKALDDAQLLTEGLSVEKPPSSTEFEKMVNRGAFQNWLSLRDQLRPKDVESS